MARFKNKITGYQLRTDEGSPTFKELVKRDEWERVDATPAVVVSDPGLEDSPESESHKVLRPAKSAKRSEWAAFLEDRGIAFAEDATKQELIKLAPID